MASTQKIFFNQYLSLKGLGNPILYGILLYATTAGASAPNVEIAAFSPQQSLWSPTEKPLSISILPLEVLSFREEPTCDSCHRISPDGIRFFLENYLVGAMKSLSGKAKITLVRPGQELMANRKELMNELNGVSLPLSDWIFKWKEPFIFRPNDFYTAQEAKKILSSIGAALGSSHLVLVKDLRFQLKPVKSNTARGQMEWSFVIIYWDVVRSGPEWVIAYREKDQRDLNAPLSKSLDKHLIPAIESIPKKIQEYLKVESR